MDTSQTPNASRYIAIDGLRGLAALSVVIYHLSGNLKTELNALLPEFVTISFSYGFLGVPIFFVISGFVISLSIGKNTITADYFGKFVLRRSIRLDPTYWVAICIALSLIFLKSRLLDEAASIPSFGGIMLHAFYLQDLLSVKPSISVVYWTLCLEIQLYLYYIISLWIAQRMVVRYPEKMYGVHLILICVTGIVSLLLDHKVFVLKIPGLFLPYWHYFFLGVLASNIAQKKPHASLIFLIWIVTEIFFLLNSKPNAFVIGGLVCSLLIYAVLFQNNLSKLLAGKTLQYLGGISYTLYLIHPDIGWKIISVAKLLLKSHMSPLLGGIVFLMGLAGSIVAAHILHVLVERPSLKLCSRLKHHSLWEIFVDLHNTLKSRFIRA